MNLAFSYSWVLLLLPLSIIPLFGCIQHKISYFWTELIPTDRLSVIIDRFIRVASAAAISSLVLGLSGPYVREKIIERIGTGAHIVLLLDHGASMNANFAGSYLGGGTQESKGTFARNLLTEFVKRRPNDLFGMVSFSTAPIYVLPLINGR